MKKQPNLTDVYVGQRIRAQRMVCGMSQEMLADQLGLTFQQVQKYEKGTNRVSASRLAQIAKALSTQASYFFEGLPSDGRAPSSEVMASQQFLATPEGSAIASAWPSLSRTAREAIMQIIRVDQGERGRTA